MTPTLQAPQFSAAKPRSGLCTIGDLAHRLIRLYELQNEWEDRSSRRTASQQSPGSQRRQRRTSTEQNGIATLIPAEPRQATFAFYDCEV